MGSKNVGESCEFREVCAGVSRAVDRWRTVKDAQEQWYAVGGVRLSSEVSASPYGLKISNIVEEGRFEYVPNSITPLSAPVRSSLRASLGKAKKRKVSRNPV